MVLFRRCPGFRIIQKTMARIFRTAAILFFCVFLLTGCAVRLQKEIKTGEPEFTVPDKTEIPEELQQKIEKNKKAAFGITYADRGYLYIVEGYGEQPTTGYSVVVNEVYETPDAICISTSLMGPEKGEEIKEIATFPYVVVQLEYKEKEVLFD